MPSNDLEPLAHPLIETIERDHLVRPPLFPADLLFVFGTRHGVQEFVDAISDLWRRGFFKWTIVSGGLTPGDDRTEAEVISTAIMARGVPGDVILTERSATNTGENVVLSLPILEKGIGLQNIESVIALGKHCTSIRYLMTLQRYWPEVRKTLMPVNYYGHPLEDWHRHPVSRARVLSEWRKIAPYKEAGFIVDWTADH